MKLDPDFLRRHYALMSDEALFEVDREELVEEARACYDAEVARRELPESAGEDAPREKLAHPEIAGDTEEPAWLDDAAEVFSRMVVPGAPAEDVGDARDVLRQAGIPCYVQVFELEPEPESSGPRLTHQWRLLVPGDLNMWAASVLERDIFNQDFEEAWRAHLEALPDAELRALHPKDVFCGLFDKVERVNRVYKEEMTRRGIGSK